MFLLELLNILIPLYWQLSVTVVVIGRWLGLTGLLVHMLYLIR